jgi:hypothetical protein
MGLIAIFSTAVIPIAVMGSILEASKLVSASWLYRNWKTAPLLLKTYFTTALVILMLLTSMGIFGYLSKAHLDQAVPTGDVASKIAILDEKIKTEKDNVDAARKAISQLDSQVDQTLARTTDDKGADRSVAIRRSQAKERNNLLNEIQTSQAKIAKLSEERAPVASELRKVEAEVGPIKYIAALIYGDVLDDTILEKSVRIVILLIVFVFDPMAVLMLIAANREMLNRKPEEEQVKVVDEPAEDEEEGEDPHLPTFPFPMIRPEESVSPSWYYETTEMKEPENEKDEEQSDEETQDDENKYWSQIVDSLNQLQTEQKVEAVEEPTKDTWIIPDPPKEVPEEFKKVVKEYFAKEDNTNEPMLYVNEEPETTFQLDPEQLSADFNPKDPFDEKKEDGHVHINSEAPKPTNVVMPDSRTEFR